MKPAWNIHNIHGTSMEDAEYTMERVRNVWNMWNIWNVWNIHETCDKHRNTHALCTVHIIQRAHRLIIAILAI